MLIPKFDQERQSGQASEKAADYAGGLHVDDGIQNERGGAPVRASANFMSADYSGELHVDDGIQNERGGGAPVRAFANATPFLICSIPSRYLSRWQTLRDT
jgi:hypothetical protein